MNIRQLKIFKVVCQYESITKAAQELYISQPAVSLAIKELEARLELNLFDRLSGKVYLNETGQAFLAKVNVILDLYDDLAVDIQASQSQTPLKIGSSITIANDLLIGVIKEFNDIYPKLPVKLIIKNARDIELMVENNEIDLGLIEGVIANENLGREFLSSYDLSFIAAPKHPLANQEITLKTLIKEDLLLRERGSAIREIFDSTMRINNLSVEPLWTSINSQVLIKAVMNNIGISILPTTLVRDLINTNKLAKLKVESLDLVNNNYIIYNRDKKFDKRLNDFKELVKSHSK